MYGLQLAGFTMMVGVAAMCSKESWTRLSGVVVVAVSLAGAVGAISLEQAFNPLLGLLVWASGALIGSGGALIAASGLLERPPPPALRLPALLGGVALVIAGYAVQIFFFFV